MRSTSPFMSLFIVMFLSGIAGQESAGPEGGSSRGATLYSQYCSACHGTDGRGDGELE
ncbi:MAG: c-type cytochrome, partial [Fidelibacterota bacterium]